TNTATGVFDPATGGVGSHIISYTVSGSCPGTDTETLVVNPLPVSDAGPDITICSATSGTIGSANNPANTYGWTAATGLSSTTLSTTNVTLSNAGASPVTSTYTLTTTVAATGCFSTDQVNVTVDPIATANAGPPQTICAGTTATLAGAVGGVATSGTWGGGAGSYSPNNNTLNAVYTPSVAEEAAGSVTLTLVSNDPSGPCPVATSTVTITINPIAIIDAGPDQTICIGNTAALAAIPSGAAVSGLWSGVAGAFSPANTDPNAVYTPTAAEEAAGSLILTFTTNDPVGPCSFVSDQMTLTISPLPTANAGLDQTICNGSNAILGGSVGGAASSGTWSGGAGTFSPNSSTLNATYTPTVAEASAGSVMLTLTTNDPIGPCTSVNDQMIITINPIATITAGPDQTICIGSTCSLAGSSGGSATSGTWTGGAGTYAPSNTDPNAVYTPTAAENASGLVTLTFTSDDPAGPCLAVNDQMIITINALPTANAGSSQTVCKGSTITLNGTVGGSASSGTWSGGAGTYAPNAGALNAVYTPTAAEYAAGTVTLTLTSNDPAGPCSSTSSMVTHNFYENPVINFSVNTPSGCPVHCVQFTDLSTVVGATITQWNWNFGYATMDSTSQNPSHCFAATGFYDITLTATSSQGCSSTSTVVQMIEVFAKPIAEFTVSPLEASMLDPEVTLNNASTPDVVYWNYNFGDGDTIAPNTPSPVHVYPGEASSSYLATLMVENSDGCRDTVQHPILIGPEFTFFIPNAFTPNGDGINDYFYGNGIGIVDYNLWIFDRWGDMIWKSDYLYGMWDGKANNGDEQAQQDVYIWKVKLTDVFGKKHNYIGTVTLVK
ncbi:MAG: PKD domain-containing protein, partial [Bacteroidota bacterium]|nr:PKD domain-containing protein [Bacteroidota bacterium]